MYSAEKTTGVVYLGHHEFDQFLLAALGPVVICGAEFPPAEVLKKLNPAHYQGLYREWAVMQGKPSLMLVVAG